MSAGESDDKQFEPTQQKLDEARKKGEIVRSNDLTTALSYGGFLLALVAFGGSSLLELGTQLMGVLGQSAQLSERLFAQSPAPVMGEILGQVVKQMLPWFLCPAILALLCVIAQRALLFTPSKIAPKLSRISPISGFKNKFGRQGLFEFFKSSAKLLVYSTILGVFLSYKIENILTTLLRSPEQVMIELGTLVIGLGALVLTVALVIGGLDFIWQSAEHIRKNRMSHKDLMDEVKQSEGDPHMKQQRRQKAMSLATNQMLEQVEDADVVIVNPTHYAVVLSWDQMGRGAPVCVAKGVDEIAARIRERAQEHGVPIHSDPPTARALYATVEIDQEIEHEHYKAVAAAIRFAHAMRVKAAKQWRT